MPVISKKGRLQLLLTAIALLTSATCVTGNDSEQDCGLYLAISSTSTVEETNWGIYAGKDYAEGVAIGSSDIAINMPFLRINLAANDPNLEKLGRIVGFFERFFWVPDTAASQFEYEGGKVVTAVPGPGVLAGYMKKMTNVDWNTTAPYFRPAGDDSGINHPNRGAVSPFYNVQVLSTVEIEAGFEIFLDYGDSWSEEGKVLLQLDANILNSHVNLDEDDEEEELTKKDYQHLDETINQMIE